MSDAIEPIKLVSGRAASRGRHHVVLMRGDTVLLAGEVNPHKPAEVEDFIAQACGAFPALTPEDVRVEVLQLAAPGKAKAAGTAPAPADGPADYAEAGGGILWHKPTPNGTVPTRLTNFTARILADVERDDGTETDRAFEIEARQGTLVRTFTIPAARFDAMGWPAEQLGACAIVYPGNAVRDHARVAIRLLSPQPIPRRTIFTHTGWRRLDSGAWAFLHGAGAIGATGRVDGIDVDLPAALALFKLPDPPAGADLRTALAAVLDLLTLAPDPIILPALCLPWRAVLGRSDFSAHFSGPSGVFKSELAALLQAHFGGELDARNFPGSWHSTDNALEGLLFAAKDCIAVIDDFAPTGGPHDVARWHQRADRIFRAQGNNAAKGRMRADSSLRPPKPPRGMVLSTGEDIPRGQSCRARMLIVEVSQGNIDAGILTRCQRDAREGRYAAAMAAFLRWLSPRYAQVREQLRADVVRLRDDPAVMGHGSHRRTPEIVANLAVGLRYLIDFAQDAGAIAPADGSQLWQRGLVALRTAAERQGEHQAANEPARRFIELVTSAIASGHAHLADRNGQAPADAQGWGWRAATIGTGAFAENRWQAQGDRIGWIDGEDVYLIPDASYRVAQAMAGPGGDALVIAIQTVRKRLAEKGWLIRDISRDTLTVRRKLEGKTRDVLALVPGVLSAKPDIPDIPAGDGAEIGPGGGEVTGPTVGNVGNVGKPEGVPGGDGASNSGAGGKVVIEL